MRLRSTTSYINIMGRDFEADIDYFVTHEGCPPIIDYVNGGDPGEDPEWEIETITLREDRGWADLGPDFEATGEFFLHLCNNKNINDSILEDMNEADYGDDY